MKNNRLSKFQWTALLGCSFIAFQIATILFKGESFCLNQGCKIIENLTTVPTIYINLAGFIYFLAVLLTSRWLQNRPQPTFDWLRLLLLTGLVLEGVLFSYQLFVAQTFCSYCLIILAFVFLLNAIYGRKQFILGIPLFLMISAAFASLNFGPSQIMVQKQNLEAGTLAVKGQANDISKLYLFFSSNCPHCKNVLGVIADDINCQLNFNPIDRIESLDLPALSYNHDYKPSINRLLLSLLNINTIPVLLAENEDDITVIKGESAIVNFINRACFEAEVEPSYWGSSSVNETNISISSFEEPLEGECEIEVECPDPVEESTSR